MAVTVTSPQGQTLHSRCRSSVEGFPKAVQRKPLAKSSATKSMIVTAGLIIMFWADYLDDGDLPAFLKSRLILFFCLGQEVL